MSPHFRERRNVESNLRSTATGVLKIQEEFAQEFTKRKHVLEFSRFGE